MGPGGAVIMTQSNPSVEKWPALVDLARRVESALA
jgi:hypothetical protein